MSLLKRIVAEKRALLIPLALGLLVNVAAYGLWVYPLGVKTAGAADRAAAAAQAVQAAEREHEAAGALVAGKARADEELATFYDKVLPPDLPSARRLTYTPLPALARKTNVKFLGRHFDVQPSQKDSRLGVLAVRTQWQGDYESLRRFIYELESAPAFVIIDDVVLSQNDPDKPLSLILQLSTYYRLNVNGN